jgi:hypothetical protein
MEFEDYYVTCSLKHTMEHWLWCAALLIEVFGLFWCSGNNYTPPCSAAYCVLTLLSNVCRTGSVATAGLDYAERVEIFVIDCTHWLPPLAGTTKPSGRVRQSETDDYPSVFHSDNI